MTAVLTESPAHRWVGQTYDSLDVAMERPDSALERLIRIASVGALVAGVSFAVIGLTLYAGFPNSQHLPLAVGATAIALVLHVRHLRYALVRQRAPAAGWTLAALAIVIIGPTPFIGPVWLQMFHVLAASAFLVLTPRWAIAAFVAVAAGAAAWALMTDWSPDPAAGWAAWFGLSVASRALAPIVLVWLVRALRQLDAARRAVAQDAVELERRRIADEFRRSVGRELEALVAQAVRASELVTTDHVGVEAELQNLVDASRRTLATARLLLHRPTLSALGEIEGTVAILEAAGVDVTLELLDRELPATLDVDARSVLQRLANELLRGGSAGRLTLTVVADDGLVRLEHRVEGAEASRVGGT